jgi:urea carboxylase
MLKSSAGGGGIGMQLAKNDAELRQVFATVQRLSQSNFGNASVFLERFIVRARHLEVQLFGDGRGRVAALGERDCSAQRRNQKVIEETPAPNLAPVRAPRAPGRGRRARHERGLPLRGHGGVRV